MESKQVDKIKGRYDPCTEPSDLRPVEGQDGESSGTHEQQFVKTDTTISPRLNRPNKQGPQLNNEIKQSEGENNESSNGEDDIRTYPPINVEYKDNVNPDPDSQEQVHLKLDTQDRKELLDSNFQEELKQIMAIEESFKAQDALNFTAPSQFSTQRVSTNPQNKKKTVKSKKAKKTQSKLFEHRKTFNHPQSVASSNKNKESLILGLPKSEVMTPQRNLTHVNRVNTHFMKEAKKGTIPTNGKRTVDINELIDARSNQQFIDRLSTELNKARINRTDHKAFEHPQSARAKENRKFKQDFQTSLVKNNFRSNPDVPCYEPMKQLRSANPKLVENREESDSNDSLNYNTAISQGQSQFVVKSKLLPQDAQGCLLQHLTADIDLDDQATGNQWIGNIKLKIEQELDGLKGEFRRKEQQMIEPLLSRISKVEKQMEDLREHCEKKQQDLEKIMISQEDTVGFILNSIQNLTSMLNSTQVSKNWKGNGSQSIYDTPGRESMPDSQHQSLQGINDRQRLETADSKEIMSEAIRYLKINSQALLDQYVKESQMDTTQGFNSNMHKQILLDLEKQIVSEELKMGVGEQFENDSNDEETLQRNFQPFSTNQMSNSESYDGSGVDAPPTPRSTNSEYDNLSECKRTPAPPRLQTLQVNNLSCSKPRFNSFLKTMELDQNNSQLVSRDSNFIKTPMNKMSTNEAYKTADISGLMSKVLLKQSSRESLQGPEQMNLALQSMNQITKLNAQPPNPTDQPENELLVTATEDDAQTPKAKNKEQNRNGRPSRDPASMLNPHDCDSVGTPPQMETLQSNNKEKFAMGVEPGKLKINESQELRQQSKIVPFLAMQQNLTDQHLSPIQKSQAVSILSPNSNLLIEPNTTFQNQQLIEKAVKLSRINQEQQDYPNTQSSPSQKVEETPEFNYTEK